MRGKSGISERAKPSGQPRRPVLRVVALLGGLGACSSSGGAGPAGSGEGGLGGAAGGTGGAGGLPGDGAGAAGPAGAAATAGSVQGGRGGALAGAGGGAGTGGTGGAAAGSAGTVGGAGGADACGRVPASDPRFGCKPTYAEQVAVLCAQPGLADHERRISECGSLRIVNLPTPFLQVCIYDGEGAIFAANRCDDGQIWCGDRCLHSLNAAVFECDARPMVCSADAGSD